MHNLSCNLSCIFISSGQLLLNFHCDFNIHTTFHLVLPFLKSPFTFYSCIRFGNNFHQLFIQLTLQLKSLGCPIFLAASIYLPKVNNSNTRAKCEICSKLTIKTLERRQWRCPGVFIVNFEHILYLVLMFLLLTLSR